jgi:hypothetical protein
LGSACALGIKGKMKLKKRSRKISIYRLPDKANNMSFNTIIDTPRRSFQCTEGGIGELYPCGGYDKICFLNKETQLKK